MWIEIKEPEDKALVSTLNRKLGSGESEAIALAKELSSFLLVNEISAINEARRHNVKILSTLISLLSAKKMELISSVKSELDELIVSGFRCSAMLYEEILTLYYEI